MYWLADILVGSRVDYRPFVERAHVERSKAFHKIVEAVFRGILAAPRAIKLSFVHFRQWRRRRATIDTLRGLSDHTLKDIGLTRGDIQGIASVIATRDNDVTVREYRNEFVDHGGIGAKTSIDGPDDKASVERKLPRAA